MAKAVFCLPALMVAGPTYAAQTASVGILASIINPPAIAVQMQMLPASPSIGDAVTYRIVVTNTGLATVTALRIQDTVSPVITGATSAGPAGFPAPIVTTTTGGTHYEWSWPGIILSPAASMTFTITGVAGVVWVPTVVGNAAYITAATPAGTTTMATGEAQFTLFSLPVFAAGLASSLSVSRAPTAFGQPAQFVLSVTNTGGTTVTNLTAVLWTEGSAAVGAPSPALVAAVNPGAQVAFSWTVVPSDSRALTFFAVVSGFTASSTGTVPVTSAQVAAILPGLAVPDASVVFVFPSPARDAARFAYTMAEYGTVKIRVYNTAGQLAVTLEESKPAGVQTTAITTSRLAPGLYFYLLERKYVSGKSDKIGPRKFAVVR